ncbi:hypothetical protein [Nonomuraea sp. JJY05]|uniref:hypothetical protein n=1 Tax=Nonomuraea sp. JJY05 TaxID=3350255 RepID=UPI00373EBD39
MAPTPVVEPLTHHPPNAVTGGVWRVRRGSAVLKVLTRRKEGGEGVGARPAGSGSGVRR